ncbi:aldolase [Anaeramoeba flamelloides]|uniref:deoxyribose-phosphate aldolase n=1 Tax=Anaeramoeba flamelloides TaxID=1746091 RepID=A0ABQ8YYR9_9EUKA|nr:aldolase [Anaeramoeba flamelloides]
MTTLVLDPETVQLITKRANRLAKFLNIDADKFFSLLPHLSKKQIKLPKPTNVASYIDHTNLHPYATKEDIIKICKEAKEFNFASVCVNASRVREAYKQLKDTKLKVAAVVGFPLGSMQTESKVFESVQAVEDGATELDMVIDVGKLKSQDYKYVLNDIQSIVEAIDPEVHLKVILETCKLDEEEIVDACLLSVLAGAQFVKTSTGFSTGGAKAKDIKLMKSVVGENREVKASGGIRTYESSLEMILNGATRIGASKGVQIVNEERNKDKKNNKKEEKKHNFADVSMALGAGVIFGLTTSFLTGKKRIKKEKKKRFFSIF